MEGNAQTTTGPTGLLIHAIFRCPVTQHRPRLLEHGPCRGPLPGLVVQESAAEPVPHRARLSVYIGLITEPDSMTL